MAQTVQLESMGNGKMVVSMVNYPFSGANLLLVSWSGFFKREIQIQCFLLNSEAFSPPLSFSAPTVIATARTTPGGKSPNKSQPPVPNVKRVAIRGLGYQKHVTICN